MLYLCIAKLINNIETIKKMEKNYSSDTPVRATLKDMSVGDITHFPIARLSVVRATSSTLGLELDRQYTVKQNRGNRTADVTRLL